MPVKVMFIGMTPLDSLGGDSMEAHVVNALKNIGAVVAYSSVYGNGRVGNRVRHYLEKAVTDFHILDSTPVDRALIRLAKEFSPDVIMVLLGNYTTPATIKRLQAETRAPVICWCQDHMGTMGRQYIIGARFDYLFAKDQVMVDRFRQFTTLPEVHYLPEACNPSVHAPVTPTDEEMQRFGCDVTTAATLYYFRSEILTSLKDFNIKIWGPVPRFYDGEMRQYATGESVFTRDKAACFNAARVVVNSLFPMEMGGLNARAFEVAGCGGFQLISDSDAVSRHFVPGEEIETFASLDELREKVIYYLEHDDQREKIAAAGRIRAHTEHTYENRLAEIFRVMGIQLPTVPEPASHG